jgi:type I restriction enzyme R subunit
MAESAAMTSANFAFLAEHDPLLLRLCVSAERNYHDDPNTTVIKLRQFGEAVVQHLAAIFNITSTHEQTQADLLKALQVRRVIDRNVADLLHYLRREGNQAAHQFETTVQQAKSALKIARELALWFHRAMGKGDAKTFKAGSFIEPTRADHEYRLAQLSSALELKVEEARAANQLADAERLKREAAEAQAASASDEKTVWAQLAQEEERERQRLSAEFEQTLTRIQAESKERSAAESSVIEQAIAGASQAIALDESETRAIIDAQLNDAGWLADTDNLCFSKGVRPEAGKCKAIAEWPTASGPADYVLFHGLTPLAVVEAKKYGSDISGDILQAERYSHGYQIKDNEKLPQPTGHVGHFPGWLVSENTNGPPRYYRIPFAYSTNGRPYLRQLETKSGIWFRDLRLPTHHARPLNGWHTPDHLVRLLDSDALSAATVLRDEPFGYLGLRDYQVRAVQAVETNIAKGVRECLLAMATGTGKTRTIIGLIYRLLKAKRFNRVLFLVDRTSLGEQAQNAFKDMRLEQNQGFTEIYDVKELADIAPDSATKVQVATVQGMVRRIFGDGAETPIDRYDCIIVDEAHRGYILDREMGEGELEIRSEADYISSYRRVLDHFDAVKVALTATPAQHTVEIFGHPVFTYTYREAVIDGWLIDHEPPIRIVTKLAEQGIHFDKGDSVQIVKPATGSIDIASLPDELDFEIDGFNRLVITENYNRIVCEELAKQLDPTGEQKTLIFCANDNHADLVVKLLKDALEQVWGQIDDKTVMKITGRTDKPLTAIRLYKNERLPLIAVTVDLLTTGIDVPPICNLVFLRRVRSRILYEQMLGRATRLCPEIEKEVFRIFDAVDIYAALDPVSTMKPVVQTVSIPLAQLFAEIADEKSHQAPGSDDDRSHADDVRDQIVVRLRSLVRRALKNLKEHPELKEPLDLLEKIAGVPLTDWPTLLKNSTTAEVASLVRSTPALLKILERLQLGGNGGFGQVISTHDDQLITIETGYGNAKKPEDYLDAFRQFILDNRNKIAALNIAVTRPRELTREDLKQLRMVLAEAEFSEATIRTAWREAKNEDIAASIIGYIRQLALGSPLVPFEARVDRALKKILASRKWPAPQQKWLERIAKEMKRSIIIDRTTFEEGAFKNAGGFKNLQHVFGGDALTIIDEFEDVVWEDAA